eukprot:TRINITY_DN1040_c0_g1_i1.p1 TRINITY_DN1040_c0_g1~~TRINITY_DN1040_c0_g1_i1.p1  ORF type:complete len:145 (-),score=43.77 TRINITY_DN1040_c0_g1_i1:37-471(-)
MSKAHTTQDLQAAFSIFDENQDGTISATELRNAIESLGYEPHQSDIDELLRQVDKNNDGVISFDEFTDMINEMGMTDDESLKQAFKLFDTDGNGVITRDELKEIMMNLEESFDEEELDDMIERADIDHDGQIDLEEFIIFLRKT